MRALDRLCVSALLFGALAFGGLSCGTTAQPLPTAAWLTMRTAPAVDPSGPPGDLRWAIERLLGRGLVDEDSAGRIVPALARVVSVSEDGRTYTFSLHAGLRFGSGDSLRSVHIRAAIEAGLARRDHATHRWLLRSVEGVGAIRPGRALPKLGIETPDDTTLILRLSKPDSLLLPALALPGVSTPWRMDESLEGWSRLDGVGPYRILEELAGRSLVLVRREAGSIPVRAAVDTLRIRFATGARARSVLRGGSVDVAWPVPLGDALREDVLEGYRWGEVAPAEVRPARRLELVLRADLNPTARLAARRAMAHSINRPDFERTVAHGLYPFGAFWPGNRPFEFPQFDQNETVGWLARGRLGRSFHTTLVHDPDEIGEPAARRLQSHWVRADLSVDLRPLRGARLTTERLSGRAQLLLQITHSLLNDPATDLAMIASPGRDAPVGSYRSGWRTADFRAWLAPGAKQGTDDLEAAQRSIEEATVVLPLGRVGWSWIQREALPDVRFHPHFGVEFTERVTPGVTDR